MRKTLISDLKNEISDTKNEISYTKNEILTQKKALKITENDDFRMKFSKLEIITPPPNISLCGALAPHQ